MKNTTLALAIIALSLNINAGSLRLLPSGNINRNAGQTIPVRFQASGFTSDQTVNVWLVDARYWIPQLISIDNPVVNGLNVLEVPIPWSWWAPGTYVVKIVGGGANYTGSNTIRIRSAVIWPYRGSTYYHDLDSSVVWATTRYISADYLTITLINTDTGERTELGDYIDPWVGQFTFRVPEDAQPGNHYRIKIEGFLIMPEEYDLGFSDLSEETDSELISVR
jgi:hypothetical protein